MQTTPVPQEFSRRIGHLTKVMLLLLLLGAVLGAVLVGATGRPEPIAMAPSALRAENLALAPQVGSTTSDLVYRPLFWAERRPAQEPEPEPVVVQEPLPVDRLDEVVLLGVFLSGGRSGVIVEAAGESHRLILGEQLNGWSLEAISSQSAEFSRTDDGGDILQESLVLEHLSSSLGLPDARVRGQLGGAGLDGNNNEAAGTDAGNQQQERNTNE